MVVMVHIRKTQLGFFFFLFLFFNVPIKTVARNRKEQNRSTTSLPPSGFLLPPHAMISLHYKSIVVESMDRQMPPTLRSSMAGVSDSIVY